MAASSTSERVLNFRRIKQDFSASSLRDGKLLYDKGALLQIEVVACDGETVDIAAQVQGQYGDLRSCKIELLRTESQIAHSSCGCQGGVDCQHIACMLLHLEKHFPELFVEFLQRKESKKVKKEQRVRQEREQEPMDIATLEEDSQTIFWLKEAEEKAKEKMKEKLIQQQAEEFMKAGAWLARSEIGGAEMSGAFDGTVLDDITPIENVEMIVQVGQLAAISPKQPVELQFLLRIPGKSKPICLQHPKLFFQAVYLQEPLMLGSTRARLTDKSFGKKGDLVCDILRERGEAVEKQDKEGRPVRSYALPYDAFLQLLSILVEQKASGEHLSCILVSEFSENQYEIVPNSSIRPIFHVQLMKEPLNALHVDVTFELPQGRVKLREVRLLPTRKPLLLSEGTIFALDPMLGVRQVMDIESIASTLFPESIFPTFCTYALPNIEKYGDVMLSKDAQKIAKNFSASAKSLALPTAHVSGTVGPHDQFLIEINYAYGEGKVFPEIVRDHTPEQLMMSAQVPRNLWYEKVFSQELTWGMGYDEKQGEYGTKSEKKILEFFSEIVPTKTEHVAWSFDGKIGDVFCFQKSSFSLSIGVEKREDGGQASAYQTRCRVHISTEGPLAGIASERILEAFRSRRYLLDTGVSLPKSRTTFGLKTRHIPIAHEELADLVELIQDTAIPSFESGTSWSVPLSSLFGLDAATYSRLNVTISIDPELTALIATLESPSNLGQSEALPSGEDGAADGVSFSLRHYQKDGVEWMLRLRQHGLSGILADDMGLGKTIQTIVLLAKVYFSSNASEMPLPPTMIVCPTSLLENWQEEIAKFEPRLKTLLFSGTPSERRKLAEGLGSAHVIIVSYGVLQREIEAFEKMEFMYVILDEAQTIKNRETRNARSTKRLRSQLRLVLTGTPLENSLEDIWSLFDFLMPGFLGSFEKFSSTYIKPQVAKDGERSLTRMRKKIQPFILRRMKQDVLKELPPITHQVYYSVLKEEERDLYNMYARKARDEIEELVAREGFDKARLHVLATISKLKQICCHPSLVDRASAETEGEEVLVEKEPISNPHASKYELLDELIETLIRERRKTVIFSQYTRMLSLMRQDLQTKGVKLLYLDGATKNRLTIVKQFNEDPSIHVFLVSLKAGGTGLNLVGADTVIHYEPWWNPAVEMQATDRVWRMGQKTPVSSYQLIVRDTIEEKIIELQKKKQDMIGDLMQSDEETFSKFTYDDVQELFEDLEAHHCGDKTRCLQKI